jgi:hypothetical protein
VGVAYFLIAVVVPIAWLQTRGERGNWTTSGVIWSLLAGTAGALGALGIILAFKFRGSPVYVMPLVFGCAPIVNTFVTMWMGRTFKEAGPIFFAGIVIVAVGAAGVLVFQPQSKKVALAGPDTSGVRSIELTEYKHGKPHVTKWQFLGIDEQAPMTVTMFEPVEGGTRDTRQTAESLAQLQKSAPLLAKGFSLWKRYQPLSFLEAFVAIPLSIALTALCWGSYGPVLHRGQMKMEGSRLRPLLCVGLAYFAIAVIVPLVLLPVFQQSERGDFLHHIPGALWSLAAGAAGAIGALGIIMAFTFGGKPIYVMPLVFGCAPIVNTVATITHEETWQQVGAPFFAALLLVVAGAVMVLIFAPKGKAHGASGGDKGNEKHAGDSRSGQREAAATK